MATITVKTNNAEVMQRIRDRLGRLRNKEVLLRPVLFDVLDLITKRIHIEGKDGNDQQIGTYSDSYLAVRERNKRGKDKKVIVSLTRNLENHWAVIATDRGYGLGFLDPLNPQKMGWVEEHFNTKIAKLTPSEHKYAIDSYIENVQAELSK